VRALKGRDRESLKMVLRRERERESSGGVGTSTRVEHCEFRPLEGFVRRLHVAEFRWTVQKRNTLTINYCAVRGKRQLVRVRVLSGYRERHWGVLGN
jgi:hypothetical protein